MADFYSHVELAMRVISGINYDFNEQIVKVGAQGPDPLYYNVFSKEAKTYKTYADHMHETNVRMLLSNMTKYVKEHPSRDNYSYLSGFIAHFALDVHLHPYVYYNVGVYQKDLEESHQYRGLHLKFERSIDVVLMRQNESKKPHRLPLHKTHFPLKKLPQETAQIMEYALKQTYGKDGGAEMIQTGIQKMYQNIKYLVRDRFGIKKRLLAFYDKKHHHDIFYQDISLYNHTEDYDYLNEGKQTWHHPVTNQESNLSVAEMLDNANRFAQDIMKEVHAYIWANKKLDLDQVFPNLSFNSGMDLDTHPKLQYFKNYRK